jgi:hypothetical protein
MPEVSPASPLQQNQADNSEKRSLILSYVGKYPAGFGRRRFHLPCFKLSREIALDFTVCHDLAEAGV